MITGFRKYLGDLTDQRNHLPVTVQTETIQIACAVSAVL
jgi:hypothetical protein